MFYIFSFSICNGYFLKFATRGAAAVFIKLGIITSPYLLLHLHSSSYLNIFASIFSSTNKWKLVKIFYRFTAYIRAYNIASFLSNRKLSQPWYPNEDTCIFHAIGTHCFNTEIITCVLCRFMYFVRMYCFFFRIVHELYYTIVKKQTLATNSSSNYWRSELLEPNDWK